MDSKACNDDEKDKLEGKLIVKLHKKSMDFLCNFFELFMSNFLFSCVILY